MNEIIQYLKTYGERLDTEIAAATGFTLDITRQHLSVLAANNEVMACHSIRYEKGKKIEGISCRLVGMIVKAKPGNKPKAQPQQS